MKKIICLLCILLFLCSSIALAIPTGSAVKESNPGFVKRIFGVFNSDKSNGNGAVTTENDNSIEKNNKCKIKHPELYNPLKDRHGCNDGSVVICFNKYLQELFCPSDYRTCSNQYSFCRVVYMRPPELFCSECPVCEEIPKPDEGPKPGEGCCCELPDQEDMLGGFHDLGVLDCKQRNGQCVDWQFCRESSGDIPMNAPANICCLFNNQYDIMNYEKCQSLNGRIANMVYCQEDMSGEKFSRAPAVPKQVITRSPRSIIITPINSVQKVCCKIGSGYSVISEKDCRFKGQKVDKKFCQQPKVTASPMGVKKTSTTSTRLRI